MSNCITNNVFCQADNILHDKQNRRERPWALHKLNSSYIALAYDEIDKHKAERIRNCASWLEFKIEGDSMKLHNANFCRVRLCSMCAWRRSLKTYAQVRSCMDFLGNSYSYIFLTLTIPNCFSSELNDKISHIVLSFNRLMKYKCVSKVVKGYYRGLEITHNTKNDTYHPHLHCIIAVNKSYFTDKSYLSHEKWLDFWRKATRDNTITQLDVRKLKGNVEHACAEVAKYSVKSSDVICFDDWDLTVDTVRTLDNALQCRRLIGFGGCFKDAHKALHLDDSEDGDLTHIETNIVENSEIDTETIVYAWHTGYCQYIKQ